VVGRVGYCDGPDGGEAQLGLALHLVAGHPTSSDKKDAAWKFIS